MTLTVDLVEPFYGGSHQAWADGWASHSDHEVRCHTMPASGWRWRMRGASSTLAPMLVEAHEHHPADLLVVSDMIDLGDLLARTRTTHTETPLALYLHENQLTYPRQSGEDLDAGLAWITWRNLTLADEIWINSAFHRDELLAALPPFLEAVPDHNHLDLLEGVAQRIRVLPVGVEIPESLPRTEPPLILSNQRWHHDKDVASVVRALLRLAADGVPFRAAVVGDHRGGHADEIDPLLDRLGDRLVARGHQDRAAYEMVVGQADIVVSAARNEFFGIAVVEALGAGAVPVLPNALAYPEVVPVQFHASALYERGELRPAIERAISDLSLRRAAVAGLDRAMDRFRWTNVAPAYDRAASALAASGHPGEH